MKKSNFITGHNIRKNFDIKRDELVVGISCYLHDSAVSFLQNGKIIYASQEERHSRLKNDNSFPFMSLLNGLKFLRLFKSDIKNLVFHESLNTLSQKEKKKIKNRLINDLKFIGINPSKLYFLDHHYSHAAAGYFSSNFKKALIFSFDGMGEKVSTSIFRAENNKITNIKKIFEPNSLGLLYSAFTYLLGFDVNSGEYKMMGLAPFGKAIYEKKILDELVYLYEDGSFEINKKYFNFYNNKSIITNELQNFFSIKKRNNKDKIIDIHCNIAASIQMVLEKIIFKMISYHLKEYNTENIILAGGVALNCIANGKIEREFNKNVHIFPSPGDSGNSYGSAVYATFTSQSFIKTERSQIENVNFGPSYNDKDTDIDSLIKIFNLNFTKFEDYKDVVELLVDDKVIGFFNGRSEFGPRALGNRSIIADPRNSDAQKKINLKIKFRESFRPFAPIILEDHAGDYFQECKKSPFMQKTYYLKKDKLIKNLKSTDRDIFSKVNEIRSVVPAITHVDYSARVQTISDKSSEIYKLLNRFYEMTGCPMLVNTSFNVNNEPIVETPYDAIKTLINTNIDYLIIRNLIIYKKNVS